jgi:hypothetical protein
MSPNPPIISARSIRALCPIVLESGKLPGAAVPALLALVAAVGFLAGCAHAPEIKTAPGFTAAALQAGGLVNLGVVEAQEPPLFRPSLNAALEAALAATRPDIPVTPAARARPILGDSTSRFLLLSFELHGKPEQVWLARAADSLRGGARYGVFVRVESQSLAHSTRDDPATSPAFGGDRKFYTTVREAHVSVVVYDLAERAPVFSGDYSGTSEAAFQDSTPRPPPPPSTTPAGWSANGGPTPTPIPEGAPEPPLEGAVRSACVEFARSLPGGTSSPAQEQHPTQ